MIKLLIIDDSALMRRQLMQVFEQAGGFDICLGRNGREAVELNRSFAPDVVTLDINMPEMDGLSALSLMMLDRPVPVVMVSSLTEQGALATFEAMNLGAVDYVAKPSGTISLSLQEIEQDLLVKVRVAAKARIRSRAPAPELARAREPLAAPVAEAARRGRPASDGLVLIGVSTGGPSTLEEILPALPASFPWPILVAQHMPAAFTRSFAERMDKLCALNVLEVAAPTVVQGGHVYIARGGADMLVAKRGSHLSVLPKPESPAHLWHPSVELLARSALQSMPARQLIGVMLTGMGNDGAAAFAEICGDGGRTIAESESSCVVFGMPKDLIDRGGASVVLPASKIATQLRVWLEQ
ncbi:chemotaxis-specific protein-glutamate methyltransferase CheB [Herbaspirillum seropedicae]|uniref:chemotaxis-specific protein-glutamate methyltransferase CheB n=1 Tax=Herbaspirillum seropedicae TaxID=964 RepID=UPI0031D2D572